MSEKKYYEATCNTGTSVTKQLQVKEYNTDQEQEKCKMNGTLRL